MSWADDFLPDFDEEAYYRAEAQREKRLADRKAKPDEFEDLSDG